MKRTDPHEPTPEATRDAAGSCTRCGLHWTYVDSRSTPHPRGHTCPPGYEEEERGAATAEEEEGEGVVRNRAGIAASQDAELEELHRRREREEIVRWLRAQADQRPEQGDSRLLEEYADRIERGEGREPDLTTA